MPSHLFALVLVASVGTAQGSTTEMSPPGTTHGPGTGIARARPPRARFDLGGNLVINGDFEDNTATCSSNLSNPSFDSTVANAHAFGAAQEIDVYNDPAGCGYGDPPLSGTTKVAIHRQGVGGPTDAFSLDLSAMVVAGQTYRLTCMAESVRDFDTDVGEVVVGLSGSSNTFGVEIFRGLAQDDLWTLFQHDFVAPVNASFLTVQVSDTDAWIHVDAFTLTSIGVACFTLGFDTDDSGNPLVHGQHVDTEFAGGTSYPVTITSSVNGSSSNSAAILDSDSGPALQDPDLLVQSGNILILQTDANLSECPPGSGIYCSHNDDEDGGTLGFAFATPAQPLSLALVDIDSSDPTSTVVLTDVAGNTRTYTVPTGWTGDYVSDGPPGRATLDLTVLTPQPGPGPGNPSATAAQSAGYAGTSVVRVDVHLGGSGAVDDLSWCTGGAGFRAAVTPRNGSGINPETLASPSLPLIGGTWGVTLDCSAHAGGLALLFLRGSAVPGFTIASGEVLVGGENLVWIVRNHGGSVAGINVAIPNDVALVGLRAFAQGYCTGAPGGQLSNALDIVLGF